ncbi:MAG: chemotaxis protein CheW [Bacilli bacterium]
MKLVKFRIAKEYFALPIEAIQSIERVPSVRRVPAAPSHIVGIANLRGTVVTVIDMRERLGALLDAQGEDARLLVTKDAAYLVDEALDILEVDGADIEWRNIEGESARGVLQEHDHVVGVLRPEVLL